MTRNILWILLLILSCSTPKQKSWDEQNVRSLEVDSPEVERAMQLAQENIENFLRHYTEFSNDSTWSYFVKYGFQNSETTEHMWLNVFQIDPTIKGILDNVPQQVEHVVYLDAIDIFPALVEDFMMPAQLMIIY